ncbi:MAG: hypothetical protein ACRECO_09200 [Xanthobacteraceae bacterium]
MLGALAVYALSFASQFLLAVPIMARGGFVIFVLVQGIAIWSWYALHAKRLQDCGRSSAAAVAIAILYALAVILCLLIMAAATVPATSGVAGDAPRTSIFEIFLFLFLVGAILREPLLGAFGYILLGVLALALLPFVIALSFSVWLATRPSAPLAS